jgi:hypothetical protein
MSRFLLAFGICGAAQYADCTQSPVRTPQGELSYQLLRTSVPPSADEIARFEHLIRQIQLSNGVFRTTCPVRFRELDPFLNDALQRRFAPSSSLDVHDWAASDCSTSAAWFQTLRASFPQACLTASDLSLYLIEAQLPGGDSYIFDSAGEALQYVRPPFVIRMSTPEPRFLLGNRLIRAHAQARLARLREQGLLSVASLEFGESDELHRPPYVFRKLPMLHPSAEMLRRSNQAFRIERHSVFEPLAQPCDVIRTMNIFNLGYFGPDRLQQGIASVWQSLKPGGMWIVGRTVEAHPPLHHTSLLVRTGQGFVVHERHAQKSEIEDLALTFRTDT